MLLAIELELTDLPESYSIKAQRPTPYFGQISDSIVLQELGKIARNLKASHS